MMGLAGGFMGKLPATNAVRLQCPDFFFFCMYWTMAQLQQRSDFDSAVRWAVKVIIN